MIYFHLSGKFGIHKAKVNPSQKAEDKLYSVIYKLVPQACLFTIVPIPEHHEEEPDGSPLLALV